MSHTPGPWGIVNVTVDQVMAWKPCAEYTRQRVEALFAGRESLSPPDVAALNIPLQDKLWALLHLLDEREQRLFACWCVRNTPLADGRVVWDLLTDERSRRAVEVAEAFAEGRANKEDLAAAKDAAWAAAWDTAWYAAWAAAWDTAWYAASYVARDAARDAAGDAARDAAWDAARDAQIKRLVEIAKAKEEV